MGTCSFRIEGLKLLRGAGIWYIAGRTGVRISPECEHLALSIPAAAAVYAMKAEESIVKKDIHPKYVECKVVCACGNAFVTQSTVPDIHVEICSACHPFYTGKQKFVDSEGRVDRFNKKYAAAKK